MIPLGTGLFKTMYDTKMHNEIIKQKNDINTSNAKNNQNEAVKGGEKLGCGYEDNENIIEVKLRSSNNRMIDKNEISSKLSFNLVDLIH